MGKDARAPTIFFILATCVVVDQMLKITARIALAGNPAVVLLGGLVRFRYIENGDGLLGLGAGLPAPVHALLKVGPSLLLAIVLAYLLRSRHLPTGEWLALSVLGGGALGNQVDMVLHHGRAIDYVAVAVGPIATGIFNLADVLIASGSLMFLLLFVKRVRAQPH